MRSETNQQNVAARNTKLRERIKRLRSSSRCSRKDIWPPSCSSLPLSPLSARKSADIIFLDLAHTHSLLGAGLASSATFSNSPSETMLGCSSSELDVSRAMACSEVATVGASAPLATAVSRIAFCSASASWLGPEGASSVSSRVASLSQVRLNSSEALRNSARFLPSVRLIWGNLRGPKNTNAMIKMKISSVLPRDSRIRKTTFEKYLSTHSSKKRMMASDDCNPWPDKAEG